MKLRVLITRPQPGADETAKRIRALSLTPVVVPLTQTVPLDQGVPAELQAVSLVAVTSPNAVRHASGALLGALQTRPFFAVGTKTGEVAQAAGLQVDAADAGDAEQLAEQLINASSPGDAVAILCGRVRRGLIEQRLRNAGRSVVVLETYDTCALAVDAATVSHVDVVLLYSAFAAEVFMRVTGNRGPEVPLNETRFICISSRVAERLDDVPTANIRIATQPDEEGMMGQLALLR